MIKKKIKLISKEIDSKEAEKLISSFNKPYVENKQSEKTKSSEKSKSKPKKLVKSNQ